MMSSRYSQNDDLSRAIDSLTIYQVWEAAAKAGDILSIDAPPMRDGVYKSPFRDDGRKGSFSICHQGRGFKDFGGDQVEGGIWKFALLCWPQLTKKEVAQKLIELSGITPTPRRDPRSEPVAAGGTAPIDPKIEAAAKALARRDKAREIEERLYAERDKLLLPKVEAKPLPTWPDFVRDRYEAGERRLLSATAVMSRLARDRGWEHEWVAELANMGLLSFPLEPFCDETSTRQSRQKAFRVDVPDIKCRGAADSATSSATAVLRPVGYHQRWFKLPPAGSHEAPQKGWRFVPAVPERARTKFEQACVEYGAQFGVTPDNRSGLVPPLPFVMGDVGASKLVVILEGQWDAITFFGACGFFNDATPPVGVSIFGIRGATAGPDTFLAYWGAWLKWNKPRAWVIADNDNAGQSWLNPPSDKTGPLRPPTFAEKLAYHGCRSVMVTSLKPGPWGKDFNDYYRHARPGPEKMRRWAQHTLGECFF